MENVVLHAQTEAQLRQFLVQPGHALILSGLAGSGKTFVAEHMAAALLGIPHDKLGSHAYFRIVVPEKGTIPIESIRTLRRFTQLKTIGVRPIRRVAIIEHAHTLSGEAQNALLKTLEEPPEDTVLILTAHNSRALLATIRSRAPVISVRAPEAAKLQAFFAPRATTSQAYTQNFFMSGGLPGLLNALLKNDEEHPLVAAIAQAKRLLKADTFERLTEVDTLSKQKETAAAVVEALARIAQAGIDQAAAKNAPAAIKRWHHILKAASQTSKALLASANAKLALTNLMLHI